MSDLGDAVRAGDRRSLARAIKLVESTRPDHREEAVALLDELLPATGGAVRVGISGAPGAGKSTFIEALGLHVVAEGHRVAVLAVDPSSTRSGGLSIWRVGNRCRGFPGHQVEQSPRDHHHSTDDDRTGDH